MTEDVLEEQSEVLAKLGTSAEGAHLRARMQSACLLSDMESFKVTTRIHHFAIAFRLAEVCRIGSMADEKTSCHFLSEFPPQIEWRYRK